MASKENKLDIEEKLKEVRKQHPEAGSLNWYRVFQADPAIAGRIIGDVIKNDSQLVKRPGKRGPLPAKLTAEKLRQLQSDDYTDYAFPQAFRILAGKESIRKVAAVTDIQFTRVFKLLNGAQVPTLKDMEMVATAYGKHPSYFHEYRIGYISAMLAAMLESSPETSMVIYKKIIQHQEG